MSKVLTDINLPELDLVKEGKVRSMYSVDGNYLMVASDRISAFDVILPDGIPGKGSELTKISVFWFDYLKDIVGNHLITADIRQFPEACQQYAEALQGRSMLVKPTEVLPVECIVRGYLTGSGWKEYQKSGTICGLKLPADLPESAKLKEPLFTPSTKAEIGEHDENISFEQTIDIIGQDQANTIRDLSLALYQKARDYAEKRGIIIADTKFEFGRTEGGELILIDEVLTPDSSRFWPAEHYQVGQGQPSYDKQYVRDYLNTLDWDKTAPGPNLPAEVIAKTAEKYHDVVQMLTTS